MGCFHSCSSPADDDDEYPPLLAGSESPSSDRVSVPHTAEDLHGHPTGSRPRWTARLRSKTFTEGSLATEAGRRVKKVRHRSYGGSRGARSFGSSSTTLTDDVTIGCSTDAMVEEDAIREFFGPSEDV